jgi:hypothetical protein
MIVPVPRHVPRNYVVAPLHVAPAKSKEGEIIEDRFVCRVGENGRNYTVTGHELLRLIRSRCGFEQLRLGYKG